MSYWGRCLTGAVVYLVSCRTGTVVVPGQLSYLDSCLPGQLLPGQLSWGTVVAWGDVGASTKLLTLEHFSYIKVTKIDHEEGLEIIGHSN